MTEHRLSMALWLVSSLLVLGAVGYASLGLAGWGRVDVTGLWLVWAAGVVWFVMILAYLREGGAP